MTAPAVLAELDAFGQLFVPACPWCAKSHHHGSAVLGLRLAHCGRGSYLLFLRSAPGRRKITKEI